MTVGAASRRDIESFRMSVQSSPLFKARTAGALYLVVILGGAFAEAFVRQRMIVHGDAAATAANLLANEQLYRFALIGDLVPLLCNVLLAVLFYDLFKIVRKSVAMLVAAFCLMGSAIQGAALVFHIAALLVLKGGTALSGLAETQLQSLAYLSLRLQANGYTAALVFFGCYGLCLGYLILKSSFLPRAIGVLMSVAGFCYFANSLMGFVAPSLSSMAFLLPCLVGEGALTLWLLIVGVNAEKWMLQAGRDDSR
jgi:hypothetical protein